jgi:acetyl esterase/lipase
MMRSTGFILTAFFGLFLLLLAFRMYQPKGAKVYRDLVYAEVGGQKLRLDLYLPRDGGKDLPLIIWIHGGGFVSGSRYPDEAAFLVGCGFASASLSYRLAGRAKFPAQIWDCKAAVRWLRKNASVYGLAPGRFGVWGASAGGHLASLLGTSAGVPALEGKEGVPDASSAVQAVCDWFGPVDFLTLQGQAAASRVKNAFRFDIGHSPLQKLLGVPPLEDPLLAAQASPVTYVHPGCPPFLIMHGTDDDQVPMEQSREFFQRLKTAGIPVELRLLPGTGHGMIGFSKKENLAEVARFFIRTLGKGGT